jgi:hypothetical protein
MIRCLFIGIGLLSMTGCGAYFVSTDDLSSYHQEDITPLGAWAVDDMKIVLQDGAETADQLCAFDEEGFAMWADIHMAPVDNGALVILSKLVSVQATDIKAFAGSLIYGLERKGDKLFHIQPFQHIDKGDRLPFASECPFEQIEGTLAEANFTPFCLSANVNPDDIVEWVVQQDDLERTLLQPIPASEIPPFCQKAKPEPPRTK